MFFVAFIFSSLFAGMIYGLWQSEVRISHVTIYGGDQAISKIAMDTMQGSYLGIIPRDSTFFLPENHIRANILEVYSDIAAISIYRSGLTGLSIKINDRVAIARWCGATSTASVADERFTPNASSTRLNLVESAIEPINAANCYFFDANGFVYKTEDKTSTVNSFIIYAPLAQAVATSSSVGSTLQNANKFPSVFDFARQVSTFGSPVISIVFRGDEVDCYLKSGTRVTYVLGNEKNAFTALSSARSTMNLTNGSLEYVDLRFDGKVYLKKVEAKK